MSNTVPSHGLGHLRVVLTENAYIGPGRADLLDGIDRPGSISAPGKAMGKSHKGAWSLVQALNEGFGRPLVETARGGAAQGGALLTPLGEEVLERYRAMQRLTEAAIAEDVAALLGLISDISK